jgi:hypothetical protein
VEHIVPKQHGGFDDPASLALACDRCNAHKGPNLTSIDPDTGAVVPLFHPRHDCWDDHFLRKYKRRSRRAGVGQISDLPWPRPRSGAVQRKTCSGLVIFIALGDSLAHGRFVLRDGCVIGVTPVGRATARLLNMNAPRRVELGRATGQ